MIGKCFSRGQRLLWLALPFACVLTLITVCLNTSMLSAWDRIFRSGESSFSSREHSGPITCYDDAISNQIEDISDFPPSHKDAIFFHETSCSSANGNGDFVFSARQACAVESAAKMNPNTEVNVLFLSPIMLKNILNSQNKAVHALLSYPNIRLKHVNLKRYAKGTPLEEWYNAGELKKSLWPTSHASDVMRYLTLWKFSGTYLDLDIVMLKSINNMGNFAGAESPRALGAGAINLDSSNVGRSMANTLLHELLSSFSGTSWGSNGPGVLTRVLRRLCQVKEVRDMTPEQCWGFTVHPPYAFYPVSFDQWEDYFNENKSEAVLKMHEDSYTAHLSNKFSHKRNVNVGSKQPYALLAAKNCPKVYATCTSTF